ncbi:MAG: hypothetical protein QF927_05555 [Verrucomicrobiota bacterium]|nr:hypothetical protein [Verrucomicrobiota bacterium]MDP7013433.1 hypothetical protein [Verrucomicrobiota bacterium]
MRLISILSRVKTKRLAKRWILGWAAAFGLMAIPSEAAGQITITTKDMFTKEGQYYKMYSNFVGHFSEAPQEEVDVFDYIGEAGEDQVWDFREGPEDELIRFDYVKPSAIDTDVEFEGATLVERATYDSTGKQKSLFVDLKPGAGRYVYGFHDESIDKENPAIPFNGRLLDFPAVIQYDDEWKASTSYEYVTRSELLDFDSPTKIVYESEMKVDAYGIIMLPGLGFHDCLRINEVVKNVAFVKIPGVIDDWQEAITQFTRNYYWLSKDMGIVAQISSYPDSVPPADEFSVASALWRQFENNHGKSTETAQPVEGLELSLDPNKKRILLSWKKAENTVEYLVQYSDTLGADSWRELKKTTGNFVLDDISSEKHRFYRIVSLE